MPGEAFRELQLIQTPRPVWITYDVDFIAEEDADALGIVPVRPVWLDLQRTPIAPGATDTGGNPVFNVQRGFGSVDENLFGNASLGGGTGRCSWPRQNCARHDVWERDAATRRAVNGPARRRLACARRLGDADRDRRPPTSGWDPRRGDLVRNGTQKPIFFSEAVSWKKGSPTVAGTYEDLTSWDFSMTVTGSTIGWKVKIKEGDILRLNAVYDAQQASWYENMEIVVALVAPKATEREDALHGGAGLDPFDPDVMLDPGLPTLAKGTAGWNVPSCTPGSTRLCLRGQVTHDHMVEATNHGGPEGAPLPTTPGPVVSVGFTYGAADLGVIGTAGIPQREAGKPARFWNVDSPIDIWHTWTRCKEPCSGPTGIAFPLANVGTGLQDSMDFDSTEIGYGLFFSPASGQLGGPNTSTDEALKDGLYWEFTPSQTGVYSLFCRIHPFMRGAFEVVPAGAQ